MRRLLLTLAMIAFALPTSAQTYPDRPITMIVPFAAGGSSDVSARIIAEEMSKVLGQRIVAENVAGAGGATGLTRAARAAPDGYTIFIGNSGTNAAVYWLHDNLSFTPDSFVPIGLVAKSYSLIAVRKDFPGATLADFVAAAKKAPGTLRLGHAGVGSQNFLICRALQRAAGIDVVLVSYRGAGPALNDLMGGHVDGVCDAGTSLAQPIRAGTVRALAVAAPNRIPTLPDIPTSAEAGLPAFQLQSWNALFAPRGTPPQVIATLNAALRKAAASDFVRNRYTELTAAPGEPDELAPEFVTPLVVRDIARFKDLLKE
jgi:tripartite-type tricarboxylate transporter receptor subunit TctC